MPAPPSLVALPPIPIIKCVRPSSSAARISSPTPYVVAMRGSRCSAGTSGRPELAAISITALRPSPISPKKASTGCPKGPVTSRSTTCPLVASTSACVVPYNNSHSSACLSWQLSLPCWLHYSRSSGGEIMPGCLHPSEERTILRSEDKPNHACTETIIYDILWTQSYLALEPFLAGCTRAPLPWLWPHALADAPV